MDRRKKFFTMRVARHWNTLLRGVVDASSLEVYKVKWDRALSNLKVKDVPAHGRGVEPCHL